MDHLDNYSSLTLEAIEDLNDDEFIDLMEQKIITNRSKQTINENWLQSTLKKLKENKIAANRPLVQWREMY